MVLVIQESIFSQVVYQTTKLDVQTTIDGLLNESHWDQLTSAEEFTTLSPVFGNKSGFKSKVYLYYDDQAIYIGGKLFDPSPDSISYSLSQRDDVGNADWFEASIDPFGNNTNAFSFAVTSAGVEVDALKSIGNTDFAWNAVWKSATAKLADGWSFEMRIPYSAIRFPNKDVQEWRINFQRNVRRVREISTWNPIDPSAFSELTQSGKLEGIQNVAPPVRLSFTPYATQYFERSYDETLDRQTWKRRLAGGMDLKYGLNDAFTLDMTLIPDFGQTTSDKQVLNLGPFEVMYNENRPFFLEGTDLFQIGDVFYSRRIGSTPFNYGLAYANLNDSIGEDVVSNPATTSLINGTKISGRTKKGLGIGFFNSIEARTEALIRDNSGNERRVETNPLTNYNVFVLSQNLKNNSTVSLVNTNVTREGANRDANVTVGTTSLYSKNGKYALGSTMKVSSILEDKSTYGHAYDIFLGKVSGKWRYGVTYAEESDTYDPNDLGFLYNNNSRMYEFECGWYDFKPGKLFYRKNAKIGWYYEELYNPGLWATRNLWWTAGGLLKNQLYTFVTGDINPYGEVNHFESRKFGEEVKFDPNFSIQWYFSSDYSKRIALDGRIWWKQMFASQQHAKTFFLSPRVRISDRMNLVLESQLDLIEQDYGYVSILDEAYENEIILGVRDRKIIENSIITEFIFTKRMGIDLRIRHYWQQVKYDNFLSLKERGLMENSAYNPLQEDGSSQHNTNYNAFTVDINYRWVFVPGSELRIVYKNNLFQSKETLVPAYFDTFNTLFNEPGLNSISVKLLVFVDALYFKGKGK